MRSWRVSLFDNVGDSCTASLNKNFSTFPCVFLRCLLHMDPSKHTCKGDVNASIITQCFFKVVLHNYCMQRKHRNNRVDKWGGSKLFCKKKEWSIITVQNVAFFYKPRSSHVVDKNQTYPPPFHSIFQCSVLQNLPITKGGATLVNKIKSEY